MGVGDSLEASYTGLQRPIPAGIWTLYGDGVIQPPLGASMITTRWEIIWREKKGDGGVDHVIATFRHTYVLNLAAPNDAIPYVDAVQAPGVNIGVDDEIVLRISPESGDPGIFFEPNGDGFFRNGKIPHIDLPL